MFGNKLKELRSQKNITQQDLAKLLNVSASTIGMYEQGRRDPDTQTINFLANYFGVTADFLLGRSNINEFDLLDALEDNNTNIKSGNKTLTPEQRLGIMRVLDNPNALQTKNIPKLGQIKMGIPILAQENYDGELEIPSDIEADFALEARGDSMIGVGLLDGDWAICRQVNTAYNGDIVVGLRDDGCFSEATLKFYFNGKESQVLRAANPEYKDIPLSEGWRIGGVLVGILRKEAPAYRLYNSYLATKDMSKEKWDSVIEQAFQMGVEPEQVAAVLKMIYQTAKK